MAGQQILDLLIGVRVPGGQPNSTTAPTQVLESIRSSQFRRWPGPGRKVSGLHPSWASSKYKWNKALAAFSGGTQKEPGGKHFPMLVFVTFSEQPRPVTTLGLGSLCRDKVQASPKRSLSLHKESQMKSLLQILVFAATVAFSLSAFADQPGPFPRARAVADQPGPFPKLSAVPRKDQPGPFPKLSAVPRKDQPGPFPKLSGMTLAG